MNMKTLKTTFFLIMISSAMMAQQVQPNMAACTGDASIYQGDNTRNYGEDIKLMVKNKKGSTVSRRSLLQFDLSKTPLKEIKKATLKLYVSAIEVPEGTSASSSVVDVSSLDNAWDEKEVTWKTAPKPLAKINSVEIANKKTWYEIDITDYVKGIFGSAKAFALALTNSDGNGFLIEFSSKEGKNKPVIILE